MEWEQIDCPYNGGAFPMLIAIITMFLTGVSGTLAQPLLAAAMLTAFIIVGIVMTFTVSIILSKTILKGFSSSFTLELPPYRMPQFGQVIVRSIFDRTIHVLIRAISTAAPCGLIIWLFANISINGTTLLNSFTSLLEPLGQMVGLDGVILTGFIMGAPANEIVLPIIVMTYMAEGTIPEIGNLTVLHKILESNGWTWITAVNVIFFSLMHWPCATTLFTIKKETQSVKWMLVSAIVPTIAGVTLCFCFTLLAKFISACLI